MDGLTTVLVVHETQRPSVRALVALCSEHAALLKRASWASVDEIVGFSAVIDCEACAMSPNDALLADAGTVQKRACHLRPVPNG